ncbi:MAG: hypothetical protein ACRDQD_11880 [Nocardioidaceae bacterium]
MSTTEQDALEHALTAVRLATRAAYHAGRRRAPEPVPAAHQGEHTTGLFDGADGLENAIGQAVGLASVCWEHPEAAGVFDTAAAGNVVAELTDWIKRHPPAHDVSDERLGLALSDPAAFVPRELGVEDYETLRTWQLRAVRAALDGQPTRSEQQSEDDSS